MTRLWVPLSVALARNAARPRPVPVGELTARWAAVASTTDEQLLAEGFDRVEYATGRALSADSARAINPGAAEAHSGRSSPVGLRWLRG